MRIGINTRLNDSQGYSRYGEGLYEVLRGHGYSCTDFNLSDTDLDFYTLPQAESDAKLCYEKELAKKAGIEIYQVHGPWHYPARDASEEDRQERLDSMKKSIRMTSVLGARYWVVHPIMPVGVEDAGTGDAQRTWDINMEFMKELLVTAKKYGITICLENMPFLDFSMSKPGEILRFVQEINDDNFKICLDTGHVSVFDGLSVGDVVRELGDEIKVFHIHDNKCNLDLHLMPYMGIIDWKDFGKALKEVRFDGVFSLETKAASDLPDDLFEETSKLLCRYAERIVAETK